MRRAFFANDYQKRPTQKGGHNERIHTGCAVTATGMRRPAEIEKSSSDSLFKWLSIALGAASLVLLSVPAFGLNFRPWFADVLVELEDRYVTIFLWTVSGA